MRQFFTRAGRMVLLFLTGGIGYFCLELAWRGWSHPAMVVVGGLCFLGVGAINEVLPWDMPIELQALLGAAIITGVELTSGIILNIGLRLNIWSYANMRGNVMGQICPQYAALWYLLAYPVIWLDDFVRWQACEEERPRYRWK